MSCDGAPRRSGARHLATKGKAVAIAHGSDDLATVGRDEREVRHGAHSVRRF